MRRSKSVILKMQDIFHLRMLLECLHFADSHIMLWWKNQSLDRLEDLELSIGKLCHLFLIFFLKNQYEWHQRQKETISMHIKLFFKNQLFDSQCKNDSIPVKLHILRQNSYNLQVFEHLKHAANFFNWDYFYLSLDFFSI